MSRIRADRIVNRAGTGAPTFPNGATVVGTLTGTATTATTAGYATTAGIATVAQGLTGTPNITVGAITASSATISGNVSVAGTVTYEDVTNVDSVGIITARTGIKVLAGGVDITAGGLNVTAGVSTFAGITTVTGETLFVKQISATGVVTASTFSGNLALSNVTGLGANVATFLATPSSSNLASAVTDETGSGALVFATSPTLVSPILGNASATTLNVTGLSTFAGITTVTGDTLFAKQLNVSGVCTAIGYFDGRVPQVPQNTQAGSYTLVKSDAGKHINAGGNVTVNSGIFAIGDCISVFNNTAGNITITQGTSVTLRLVASTSTGSRTLANYGLVAILCVGSDNFVVSGGGIS